MSTPAEDHPALPKLVLIADRFTIDEIAGRTVAAVEAGVSWVHLRDHAAAPDRFEQAARALIRRLRTVAAGVQVSINTQIAIARQMQVGLHLGSRGPSVARARQLMGAEACVGFSSHGRAEGRQAVQEGARYLFMSPVFPTASKPGREGLGLAQLEAFCDAMPEVPVFALGGVTPERVPGCRTAGAYGVAVLSGILHAADVPAAVHTYQRALLP